MQRGRYRSLGMKISGGYLNCRDSIWAEMLRFAPVCGMWLWCFYFLPTAFSSVHSRALKHCSTATVGQWWCCTWEVAQKALVCGGISWQSTAFLLGFALRNSNRHMVHHCCRELHFSTPVHVCACGRKGENWHFVWRLRCWHTLIQSLQDIES